MMDFVGNMYSVSEILIFKLYNSFLYLNQMVAEAKICHMFKLNGQEEKKLQLDS